MSNKSMFTDVPETDKYYKYYKWCVNNGLFNKPKQDGKFKPSKTITKKNLAIVLVRFYKLIKKNWGLM